MKLNKKQTIVGVSLAILLLGGAAGATYSHNVRAEKAKQVQQEKEKKQAIENAKQADKELVIQAKAALSEAQKSPSANNLELAKKAISHVKDDKTAKLLTKELDGIKNRVKLETEAKKAVADYQKNATNADKLKKAQTAVSKLTSDYSKTLKAKLTKDIAASKAQADKAKKAEAAKVVSSDVKSVDNSNKTTKSNNSEVNQSQAENSVVTDPAPVNNGAATNDNVNAYQPAPQTPQAPAGGGNTSNTNPPSTGGGNAVTPPTGGGNGNSGNNGGGTVTPPPTETFTAWAKNRAGQIIWQQGGFATLQEAGSAATAWANANNVTGNVTGPNDPNFAWSTGAY
jgi:colicin import membrane protein